MLRSSYVVIASEMLIERLILGDPQLTADDFDGDHFTVTHFRLRSSLSQALAVDDGWQSIVNQTKTCDNEIVQTHGLPPQKYGFSF